MDNHRNSNNPVAVRLYRSEYTSKSPALRTLGSRSDRYRRHPYHIGPPWDNINLWHFDDQTWLVEVDEVFIFLIPGEAEVPGKKICARRMPCAYLFSKGVGFFLLGIFSPQRVGAGVLREACQAESRRWQRLIASKNCTGVVFHFQYLITFLREQLYAGAFVGES